MAFNQPPKVLVADDDALYRMIFEEVLEEMGCAHKIVDGGSQAIMELIAAPHAYHCVVLDIYMERLDGVETGHVVRRLNRDIPIIMITGDQKKETEEKARCVGLSEYLIKPLSHEQIITAVSRALEPAAAPRQGVLATGV